LLIALDADEFFPPDAWHTAEWQTMLAVKPGTVIKFRWANVCSGWETMWTSDFIFPGGYLDDGADHQGQKIHSSRVPCPVSAHSILMNKTKVLHVQMTDLERMKSKHRWYQCWERINNPRKSSVQMFRQYHHMYGVPERKKTAVPTAWLQGYEAAGIDLTSVFQENMLWWDRDVLDCFDKYGTSFFKKLNIWDTDWEKQAEKWGRPAPAVYRDPRTRWEKAVHKLLLKTQADKTWRTRMMDQVIRLLL